MAQTVSTLHKALNLVQNMGWKSVMFRSSYEIRRKTGILKFAYPTKVKPVSGIRLEEWRRSGKKFFFQTRQDVKRFDGMTDASIQELARECERIRAGTITFFDSFPVDLGPNYDWVTNPETGYRYEATKHWTRVKDLDPKNGDIKYVWEKSRFTFLYPLIRYDFYAKSDQSEFVFREILDWIDKNPLNCGPNYVSSQEIAIRLFNWTFALYYYRDSTQLTEPVFQKIMQSIYWQTKHVEDNIDFARIAVRNNHAISECACLYLIGLLYPFFPDSEEWHRKGKEWVEEEGLYQIYTDGSYIQFSMNYHRLVIQLFTWIFLLGKKNGDIFSIELNKRLKASVDFLYQHQDVSSGQLPNYGANDGALLFKLNACDYRDFRPQLNALYHHFYQKPLYDRGRGRKIYTGTGTCRISPITCRTNRKAKRTKWVAMAYCVVPGSSRLFAAAATKTGLRKPITCT